MVEMIPRYVDPFKLANKSQTLTGEIDCKLLDRIVLLHPDNSKQTISTKLLFGYDESNCCVLKILITYNLFLECQRCLVAMEYAGNIEVNMIATRVLSQDDKIYDEILVNRDNKLDVYTLVEDEVLLDVTSFPKHSNIHCNKILN